MRHTQFCSLKACSQQHKCSARKFSPILTCNLTPFQMQFHSLTAGGTCKKAKIPWFLQYTNRCSTFHSIFPLRFPLKKRSWIVFTSFQIPPPTVREWIRVFIWPVGHSDGVYQTTPYTRVQTQQSHFLLYSLSLSKIIVLECHQIVVTAAALCMWPKE